MHACLRSILGDELRSGDLTADEGFVSQLLDVTLSKLNVRYSTEDGTELRVYFDIDIPFLGLWKMNGMFFKHDPKKQLPAGAPKKKWFVQGISQETINLFESGLVDDLEFVKLIPPMKDTYFWAGIGGYAPIVTLLFYAFYFYIVFVSVCKSLKNKLFCYLDILFKSCDTVPKFFLVKLSSGTELTSN